MERVIYDQMAELDELHWWYRARRRGARSADPPLGRPAARRAAARGRLRHRPQSGDARSASARSMRSRSIPPPGRSPSSGSAARSAPRGCPSSRASRAAHYDLIGAFDVIEHIDDDVAAVNALAACLKPGGKLVDRRPRAPVDVVGARRAQPPQAPLFEAGAAPADRRLAAQAASRSAISTACCSRSRSRRGLPAS